MGFPYIFSEDNDGTVTIFINGRPESFYTKDVDWVIVSSLLNNGDPDDENDVERLEELLDPAKVNRRILTDAVEAVQEVVKQAEIPSCVDVEMVGNEIFINGVRAETELTKMIVEIKRRGLDVSAWLKFVENIYANPTESARTELFLWLRDCQMPITDDGCFLAYKRVRDDFMDFYTGTIDNSVGNVVEMDRSTVDPDRYRTCSAGLHFCSKTYLPSYHGSQGKVLIVKINPSDVVAIPADYNNAKGRCWRYTVVREAPNEEFAHTSKFAPVVEISNDDLENPNDWSDDFQEGWYDDEHAGGEIIVTENTQQYLNRVADTLDVDSAIPFWEKIMRRIKGE